MMTRILLIAGLVLALSALHGARAAQVTSPAMSSATSGAMAHWEISEAKKPAPEKPPRPRPPAGPREGGEDE